MELQIATIFEEALKIEEGTARDAFVAQACKGNVRLQQKINLMLANSSEAEAYFDADAETVATGADAETVATGEAPSASASIGTGASEKEGDVLGPYRLLQKIGEGGFGTVWMAEQSHPVRRKVALKIIKLGMDTEEVIGRFELEKRALAMMDHSSIATVLDAGATDSGRPYFVMELVRGVPITQFCDEQKLDSKARLRLFEEVCAAVNHAHQKGIIHRDLKPSNILVTLHGDRAVPKVIDFGIAKATHGSLSEQTMFTRHDQFVGTPVYMSPEQASLSGLDIDTRSDIYSLGVILYEILTGRPPFDSRSLVSGGYEEMRRIIREDTPPKPSTRLGTADGETRSTLAKTHAADPSKLGRFVKGDLDWIVMKALEKDRARRYETANAFARDIARFLANEPVEAAAPSAIYRFKKFTRRHRALAGSLSATATILVVATAFSWRQATLARKAEGVSEIARSKAEAVIQGTNETLLAELRAIGKLPLLDGVAATATDYFDELPDELRTPKTESLRAAALENLGEVLAETNRIGEAAKKFEAAIAIRRRLAASSESPRDGGKEIAAALVGLADIEKARGNAQAAAHYLIEAAERLRGDVSLADLSTAELQSLAAVYQAKFRVESDLADNEAESESFRRFAETARYLITRSDFETAGELLAAESVLDRGDILREAGDEASAGRRYAEAVAFFADLLAQRPDDARIRKSLAVAHDRCGDAAGDAGNHASALESYQLYLSDMKELASRDASNLGWQREISVAHNECGDTLLKLGKAAEARAEFTAALEIRRTLASIDPDHADARYDLASSLFRLGEVEFGMKEPSTAIDSFSEAEEIAANEVGNPGRETRWIKRQLGALQRQALAYVMRNGAGDFDSALRLLEKGSSIASRWEADPSAGALGSRNSAAAFEKLAGQIRTAAAKRSKKQPTDSKK